MYTNAGKIWINNKAEAGLFDRERVIILHSGGYSPRLAARGLSARSSWVRVKPRGHRSLCNCFLATHGTTLSPSRLSAQWRVRHSACMPRAGNARDCNKCMMERERCATHAVNLHCAAPQFTHALTVAVHSVGSPPNYLDKDLALRTWRLRGLYAKIRGPHRNKFDRVARHPAAVHPAWRAYRGRAT